MTLDLAGATSDAEARIARGESDPHLFNLVAWNRADHGDLIGATALLDQVLARDPGEPESLTSKAALLRRQGRLRDAVLHCDAAIRSAPD